MNTTIPSVAIAMAAMVAIPAAVTALVRRGDRRRPPSTLVGDEAPGALFTVRARRWHPVLLRVFGIVFLVLGALLMLLSLAMSGDPEAAGPLLFGTAAGLFGVLFLLLGNGIARRRIEGHDDRLVVTPMFRATQEVGPGAISRIRPTTNRFGGLDMKAKGYPGTITVLATDAAYPYLCAWLDLRAPGPWGEFVRSTTR